MKKRTFFLPLTLLMLQATGNAQVWKWAKSLGAADNITTVKNIRAYTGTNVLVSGTFAAPTLSLGSQTLQNAGQDDGYVAIADAAGQYAWATKFGGSGRDFVVDAAAAPTGDFVVAGNFSSLSMSIGSVSLLNSGETDAFVAKFKADKTLAWAKKIGAADIDEVNSLAVDADGNTYVSGHVLDKFDQTTLYIFVRKLDSAGDLVWEKKGTVQGGGYLQSTALAIDDNRDIYLGGAVYGTATFGGVNLTSSDTAYAAFIVKYNPAGSVLDTYVNTALDNFNGLQVRGNHVYACAEKRNWGIGWGWPLSDSKIHVLKLDSNLDLSWHQSAGGENFWQSLDIAKNLSVDEVGNVYVTGYFFSDTIQFAGQPLTNVLNIPYYYPQIFVLKYAPSGNEIWAKSMGGLHTDEATSIHVIGEDQFFLGGNFESSPATFGAHNLHNEGSLDSIYVHLMPARYGRKTMGFLALFDKDASGTKPEPVLQQVSIFPNPADQQITLRLKEPVNPPLTLQLLASDGRLLRQTTYDALPAELREDLTGLPPGLYFVSLRTEEGVFVGKLVKK